MYYVSCIFFMQAQQLLKKYNLFFITLIYVCRDELNSTDC